MADAAPAHTAEGWMAPAFVDMMGAALEEGATASEPRPQARCKRGGLRRGRGMGQGGHAGDRVGVECCERLGLALADRLSRWAALTRCTAPVLQSGAVAALAAVRGCAPHFAVALVRVWTDAVPTSFRRGRAALDCPICGREGGDRIGHLASCSRAWNRVAARTGVAAPTSVAEAIGLGPGPRLAGSAAGGYKPPPERVFALAVLVDAAAKAREARAAGRSLESSRRTFEAAVRHAVRRLRPLSGVKR